jgi:hypothetical protein
MNFREIIEAWCISFNPTAKQKELAEARGKICDQCSSKGELLGITICKECGCPIGKKIFSTEFNPCALLKWEKTDEVFVKRTKTLI